MNFRPTLIKTLLAFAVGFESAFYFRDNCIGCFSQYLTYELFIGFIPAFLWVYGIISLLQVYEERSNFWYYVIAVPIVLIIPFIIAIFLENFLIYSI